MPEGHEDQQPVAGWVAAVAGGGDQALDLALGQVLALPIIGVLGPTTANYRFSDCEGRNWTTVFISKFPLLPNQLST